MSCRDPQTDMTFCVLRHILLLAVIIARCLVTSCSFPDTLQMDPRDPPWYSHVRTDGSRDAEYYIRHNVMEIHYPRSDRQNVRWKCSASFHDKLLLKRQDHLVNSYYRCAKFMFRSRSIVQIMWSHEVKTFDLGLCDDLNLKPDPWPLIWYETLQEDYSPCPFSGGFDMKIIDSQLGENGCNLMLRPMRMEAECLGGEGVTFNYISSNCLPAIKMYVKQRTTCATSWQDSRNHYVIIRRNEDIDLWCLVMPVHQSSNMTAYLYSDLACVSEPEKLSSINEVRFFTLNLYVREFPTLCEDEYDHCGKVTCNAYVKQECWKSCGTCDQNSHLTECQFPKDFMGAWFLKDSNEHNHVDIGSSSMNITGIGNFLCVSYPNSPTQSPSYYSTISLYKNGCRPRYTCIKLHRLGPSVLQYSLSQSYVWPTMENGICNEDRFYPDPSPVDDRYRPHEGAGKPLISYTPKAEPISCNLASVHIINAVFSDGNKCVGSVYRHCEDSNKIRLEFQSCINITPSTIKDYKCLANFEGHYWERILLVQNVHDELDVVCFVFSQYYPKEAYVLVASQCDQKAFSFARSDLRQTLMKLEIRLEADPCKSVPTISTAVEPTETLHVLSKSDNSFIEDSIDHNSLVNMTGTDSGYYIPVSIVETGSLPGKPGRSQQKSTYVETRSGIEIPSAKSTSFTDGESMAAAANDKTRTTSTFHWIFMFASISMVCR